MYKNLIRKYNLEPKYCMVCNEVLSADIIQTDVGKYFIMYECPNGCAESNTYYYLDSENNNIIYYVEEKRNV